MSTYRYQVCYMCNVVKKIMSIQYMLNCIVVEVYQTYLIYRDNQGEIQKSTISDNILNKKYV